MAITPLRWRRRMRVISSSTGSSTLIPGDLRIGLPHIVGPELEQPVELLPLEARNGQLHELRRGRERVRRRRELHMAPGLLQLPTVHQGAVPNQKDILRSRLQFGREMGG